uniref:LEM domain-containing protein n=1 Tax=Ascaris lumbricoides TaxID=6252 RepID=A0A9J2P2L6_ASCLU
MLKSALIRSNQGNPNVRQTNRSVPLKAHFHDLPQSSSTESTTHHSLEQMQLVDSIENCPVKVQVYNVESTELDASEKCEGVIPEDYEQPPLLVKIVVCFIAFVVMVICLGMLFIKFE